MADSGEDSMTKQEDIDNLLDHFARNTYPTRGDVKGMLAMKTCLDLFGKDYTYSVINNSGGQLCAHYPSQIVLLEYEGASPSNVDNRYQTLNDAKKLEELIRQSRLARCRTRFVAPVILYKGKHVCRSSTLAGWQELFSRKGMDMIMSGGTANGRMPNEDIQSPAQANAGRSQVFDQHRGKDIQLLESLDIRYICDLMVETKKVKCGFYITSSEKVDKENRYKDFNIIALPYPGCEFFSKWKDSSYDSENVHYDWAQELNTSPLDLQDDPILTSMSLDWSTYKDWDLVKLTQNYLRALVQLLDKGSGSSGVLVHCISGWDRTPLFVSMLRLSLWADGAIHKSLPPSDILYLTLAYDWYLFGHGLNDKLGKGQEIMYFCFKMLQYIAGQEFSVNQHSEGPCQMSAAPAHSCDCRNRRPSSSSMKGRLGGLRHQGSNVSLTSNTSCGSDGATFIMDTTQDEDSLPPLGWDMASSPQRSRHGSGNSSEGPCGRHNSGGSAGGGGGRGGPGSWNSNGTDSPSSQGVLHHHQHQHHRHCHHHNHHQQQQNHRRHCESPPGRDVSPVTCSVRGRVTSQSPSGNDKRGQSPDTVSNGSIGREARGGTLTNNSSGAASAATTDQPLAALMVSNHYSSSPVSNHYPSSPVNISQARPRPPDHAAPSTFTPTPSFGSWVDVGMLQMTPPHMITPPKNPLEFAGHSSINSCCEASDLNQMSMRKQRLLTVAQMFEDAYFRVVLSRPVNSAGTLSSLIGNMAEKMGLKSTSK